MKREDLNDLKRWFSKFCKSYYTNDFEDQKNYVLKERHTYRVCRNIIKICKYLSLSESVTNLANAIALLHDIGRFPQYAKFKTFKDSVSVNHGVLGANILKEQNVLSSLSNREQEIVIKSVKFHNAFSIPKNEDGDTVFFIKLIRDADKLDIWKVFIDYYKSPDKDKASAVGLGLSEDEKYSKGIIDVIYSKKIVSLSVVKTLNDFKLLQLSWIFDLNFNPSFIILQKRRYIERIVSFLPNNEEIKKLALFLKDYVRNKLDWKDEN
jgi:putative nucleotidyltransferase with HDIG domain